MTSTDLLPNGDGKSTVWMECRSGLLMLHWTSTLTDNSGCYLIERRCWRTAWRYLRDPRTKARQQDQLMTIIAPVWC